MDIDVRWIMAALGGVAIAAACGLRAFLPLLVLGLAARFGMIQLGPRTHWLEGDLALWTLGLAAALEIVGDKIPVVDHALDVIGTFVRPAAATLAVYTAIGTWPTPWPQLVSLALGGVALSLHLVKAKVRLTSTATTLGHANPLLSAAEDAAALGASVLAVLLPAVAVALLIGLAWVIFRRRRVPA